MTYDTDILLHNGTLDRNRTVKVIDKNITHFAPCILSTFLWQSSLFLIANLNLKEPKKRMTKFACKFQKKKSSMIYQIENSNTKGQTV